MTAPATSDVPATARMTTLRSVAALRAHLDGPRARGPRIGLVPTMGALHDGHLSLIRRARAACDVVVVSLFVNPTQFDDPADLRAYPRDEARDARLAEQAGADVLFAPPTDEVYPPGFATTVAVGAVAEPLEGRSRGARALRRRRDRRDEAPEHGRSRTSRTSARRTPSRSP